MKLQKSKGDQIDGLYKVVLTYWITSRTATGETLFIRAFGVEVVIPTEMGLLSYQIENYDDDNNARHIMVELDLLEEKREQALIRTTARN